MVKILLAILMIFGLLSFVGNSFADEFYKWVDAKGTIHFSDNPTSGFLHSQYKEKLIIKDGSVQTLGKMSFGERHVPDDQLMIYYKSEGGGQRRPSGEEVVSTSSQSTGRRATSSSFSPFSSSQRADGAFSGAGTRGFSQRQLSPPRKIYPRKIYGR